MGARNQITASAVFTATRAKLLIVQAALSNIPNTDEIQAVIEDAVRVLKVGEDFEGFALETEYKLLEAEVMARLPGPEDLIH